METRAEQDQIGRLRRLLHTPGQEQGLDDLKSARSAAAGDAVLGREVLEAEGRWLLDEAHGQKELEPAAATAREAMRRLRTRSCSAAPTGDVDVLFELALLAAEHERRGETDAVGALAADLQARTAAATDVERLCQEADERWAEQSSADERLPLDRQIERLRATGRLLQQLAARTGNARLRRRARRSLRAADDRQLQARLEGLLGHRGVVALETTSFVLLMLVLVVLVVESVATLTAEQAHLLHWIDGIACTFFVAEFALKFGLAQNRTSWFLRNVVTDLLPAIPAVLYVLPGPTLPGAADDAVVVRLLRLLRVTWAARYIQALRPLLRAMRLILLMVRGMDGLVRRFRGLLDRNFLFLAGASEPTVEEESRRDLVFAALRREQSLYGALPAEERPPFLQHRLVDLADRADGLPGSWSDEPREPGSNRDIAVESACEALWSMEPADVERYLRPGDVRAIDRVARVLATPPLCWMPILRRFSCRPLSPTPEERIVDLARKVADWLIGWQDRLQFIADLHGIVTGPQILDRVASAMVKASQRPAVRLLMFGALFLLCDLLIRNDAISAFLKRIVVGPLLVLGSLCLVFLTVGWWLKRIAGEASESFRLTSEAHFVSLLSLSKRRHERDDLEFLGRRALRDATDGDPADLLRSQLASARAGVPLDVEGYDDREELLGSRVALLYLHFLDGALLHQSDVKTTEQLLANLSLENLRRTHLGFSKRDKKRLRQLRLDDGSILRGPFLWFRFITESIAVETSKRITEYNRRCPPLARRHLLSAEQEQQLCEWLQRRCDPRAGRTLERLPPPDSGTAYATTEFHALHFLTVDRERDEHVRRLFGDDVLAALRADRRNMVREIFGMRSAQELAGATRSFNAWRIYWSRLSHGRVFLLPLLLGARMFRSIGWFVARLRQIVREVLRPRLAQARREPGTATFGVALRKIHRMKAPGLVEAIRTRVDVDPAYCGAPCGWSVSALAADDLPELERDLDFLQLHERQRATFRNRAAENRELVAALHAALAWLPDLAGTGGPTRADGELAVTVAWLSDRNDVRTLLGAEAWRVTQLPSVLDDDRGTGLLRRACWRLSDLFVAHPVDVWLVRQRQACGRRGRRNLRASYAEDARTREVVDAWNRLQPGEGPAQVAIARLRAIYAIGAQVRRELVALRTVQSLSVLDVRNYRDAVFELGGYGDDGEDPQLARGLP